MTISKATVVQRVRYLLGDLPWETTGFVASSSDETITVEDGTEWAKGNIGEFDDGEAFWVRSVDGFDLETKRGYHGSTAASHAEGSRILKDPRYRFAEIENAISATIQSLPWPRVYKVVSDSITPDADTQWYDIGADALSLVRVFQQYGPANEKLASYGRHRSHLGRRVMFETALPSSYVLSTVGVRFPDGFAHESNTVYVDYASRVTDSAGEFYIDLNDGDALTEAVIFGAVALLEAAMELRKPRRPSPETDTVRGMSIFEDRYRRAVANAEKDLRARHPLMEAWKGPV